MLGGSSAGDLIARFADRWLQEHINDFRFRIGFDIINVRCCCCCCSRFLTSPVTCLQGSLTLPA
jgi:hypothetical protein